jgi:hypothetical protein
MFFTSTRSLLAILMFLGSFAAATRADQCGDAAPVISRLERIDPLNYFDMHGNAHELLQTLMIKRFCATPEVMRSIDRLERDERNIDLIAALYNVLGFVKDPASIDWLKNKLAGGSANFVYGHWLPRWQDSADGYGAWEWLEGRDRWIQFFISTFEATSDACQRTELLKALAGFDDASVVAFFGKQRGAVLDSREFVMVETYTWTHSGSMDEHRIERAIDALARDHTNWQFLVERAYELRSSAFVPFLIEIVDREAHSRESLWDAQGALEKITFRTDVQGKVHWQRWFTTNGGAGREAWLVSAIESMRRLIREDEEAALRFFEKAVYRWDDVAFLPFIREEVLNRPAFRDYVAAWINLAYQPEYRSKLEPIARKLAEQAAALSPWARDLLINRDFLPGRPKGTWREHVEASNRFV